ncbi:MAG: hypothetical protein NC548_11315 [Lachnospiraceae bacterium]|nr:hypothetical protein [Lachnospiraceae bacterium]
MKKFLSLLLCISMVFTPVLLCNAREKVDLGDWAVERMDNTVREFFNELNARGYFDEASPFKEVIHITAQPEYARIKNGFTVDTVFQLLSTLKKATPESKLYPALFGDGVDFASALGFRNNDTLNDMLCSNSFEPEVTPVRMHEYVSDWRDSDDVTAIKLLDSALCYDEDNNVTLQIKESVCNGFTYHDKVYWVVFPGYTDYSYWHDILYLYDTQGDRVAADADLSVLLACAESTGTGSISDYPACNTNVPGYVFTANELASMDSYDFHKLVVQVTKDNKVTWNDDYTSPYTNKDKLEVSRLFEEYIGFSY